VRANLRALTDFNTAEAVIQHPKQDGTAVMFKAPGFTVATSQ